MTSVLNFSRLTALCIAALTAIGSSTFANVALAEGRLDPAQEAVEAEFFAAMDAGQLDVKFIPKDATQANVLIRNLTDKPMNVRLPAAFAGVPVLAQMGGMGGGMGGMGGGMGGMGGGMGGMGGGMGGGGQAMGGGMGGMGGGMGGMGGGMGGMGGGMGGMGGGMMRVAPQHMRKVTVTTVCLEHGKPDPNPKMAYKIVPLDQFTQDPHVHVVCEAVGRGLVTQNSAQAAAWHFTDKMSWQELATKNRSESKYTGNVRFFSPIEMRTAAGLVTEAKRISSSRQGSDSSDSSADAAGSYSRSSDTSSTADRAGRYGG